MYFTTTTSLITLITYVAPLYTTYPVGVTYMTENTALVMMYSGGVAKYALTNTTITFAELVLSANYYYSFTFFPGSKSQGFTSYYTGYRVQTYYYNNSVLSITRNLLSTSYYQTY
jgi:hypothetical protein